MREVQDGCEVVGQLAEVRGREVDATRRDALRIACFAGRGRGVHHGGGPPALAQARDGSGLVGFREMGRDRQADDDARAGHQDLLAGYHRSLLRSRYFK